MGITEEEYCESHPGEWGCPPKKCCRAFSAECMSCVEGITEEEYCAKNPTVAGCPPAAEEPKACCKAWNAECLSCTEGVTIEEYCARDENWGVMGCIKSPSQRAAEEAAAALPPKKCCRAFSAECMSCVEGITEEEYCAKNPTVTGCPTVGAPACKAGEGSVYATKGVAGMMDIPAGQCAQTCMPSMFVSFTASYGVQEGTCSQAGYGTFVSTKDISLMGQALEMGYYTNP
jgi:hypothetical protein